MVIPKSTIVCAALLLQMATNAVKEAVVKIAAVVAGHIKVIHFCIEVQSDHNDACLTATVIHCCHITTKGQEHLNNGKIFNAGKIKYRKMFGASLKATFH